MSGARAWKEKQHFPGWRSVVRHPPSMGKTSRVLSTIRHKMRWEKNARRLQKLKCPSSIVDPCTLRFRFSGIGRKKRTWNELHSSRNKRTEPSISSASYYRKLRTKRKRGDGFATNFIKSFECFLTEGPIPLCVLPIWNIWKHLYRPRDIEDAIEIRPISNRLAGSWRQVVVVVISLQMSLVGVWLNRLIFVFRDCTLPVWCRCYWCSQKVLRLLTINQGYDRSSLRRCLFVQGCQSLLYLLICSKEVIIVYSDIPLRSNVISLGQYVDSPCELVNNAQGRLC
jgi:hypothetical protein